MRNLFFMLLISMVTLYSCEKDSGKSDNDDTKPKPQEQTSWIVGTWDAASIDGIELPASLMKMNYTFGPITGEFSKGSMYFYMAMGDPSAPPIEINEDFLYKLEKDNSKVILKNENNEEYGEIKILDHSETTMSVEIYDEEEDEYSEIKFEKR